MCVIRLCVCTGTGREVGLDQHASVSSQLQELRDRNEVLLEMLGQTEEEMEEVKQEYRDAKETYTIQLEELMNRLTQTTLR